MFLFICISIPLVFCAQSRQVNEQKKLRTETHNKETGESFLTSPALSTLTIGRRFHIVCNRYFQKQNAKISACGFGDNVNVGMYIY